MEQIPHDKIKPGWYVMDWGPAKNDPPFNPKKDGFICRIDGLGMVDIPYNEDPLEVDNFVYYAGPFQIEDLLNLFSAAKRARFILEKATRQGTETDSPEGSRWIEISDTLAKEVAGDIANALTTESKK